LPLQRHTPSTWRSAPVSSPPRTNSRRYSGLPPLTRPTSFLVTPSTGPPRARSSSSAVANDGSADRSRRRVRPSFQSAITGSGAGSPVRTVATTTAMPRIASWCTRAAEASSSRWASSTPSSSGCPRDRSASSSAVWRRASRGSSPRRSVGGSRWETAPNGIEAAARVAASHSTSQPAASARARASRVSLVLPIPASPASTIPPARVSARLAASASSSARRPTSGHSTSTQASYTDRTGQ
jgi:hypothetical protein